MTNADRIRAMTDEELARVLAHGCGSAILDGLRCRDARSCNDCMLDWLKQEVSEDG